jgi:hypothetical protein
MKNIRVCVIGRKTKDFIAEINSIRKIEGIKVLKRRNKPFYDIAGELNTDDDFNLLCKHLHYLIMNCEAEIEVEDKDLQNVIVKNI